MRIGLFGGTFNPFHNGHITIIEHVRNACRLDRVYFIPSATPPHKPDTNLAPADERFMMVKQSLKGCKGFLVSDKELVRQGPSFTIDTINEFKQEHNPQTRFYFIMGSDAFLDINTWKNKDELFKAVPMIIMLRKGSQNNMASFIDENISKGYTFDEQDHRFVHVAKQEIRICRVPIVDISSTMIRERVKNNAPISGLVPKIVEQTIQTKELYR